MDIAALAAAKTNPGSISVATANVGTGEHLVAAALPYAQSGQVRGHRRAGIKLN
jgi:tripartite-type tricarboxylate transporter receptor subunit TctC